MLISRHSVKMYVALLSMIIVLNLPGLRCIWPSTRCSYSTLLSTQAGYWSRQEKEGQSPVFAIFITDCLQGLGTWRGGYKTYLPDRSLRPEASATVDEMRNTPWEHGIRREIENVEDPIIFSKRLASLLSDQTPILVTLHESRQGVVNPAALYSEFRLFPEDIVAVSGELLKTMVRIFADCG